MMRVLRKARMPIARLSRSPIILMYHRIAEPAFDPWGLAVSPARFEDQLAILEQAPLADEHGRTRRPTPASTATSRCRGGHFR